MEFEARLGYKGPLQKQKQRIVIFICARAKPHTQKSISLLLFLNEKFFLMIAFVLSSTEHHFYFIKIADHEWASGLLNLQEMLYFTSSLNKAKDS